MRNERPDLQPEMSRGQKVVRLVEVFKELDAIHLQSGEHRLFEEPRLLRDPQVPTPIRRPSLELPPLPPAA
jgi:hypothetical protein